MPDLNLDLDSPVRPGRLRAIFDANPHLLYQLATAEMIVIVATRGGEIRPVYGQPAYVAAGGPTTMGEVTGRLMPGIDRENDRHFPPGAFLLAIDDESDDPDFFFGLMREASKAIGGEGASTLSHELQYRPGREGLREAAYRSFIDLGFALKYDDRCDPEKVVECVRMFAKRVIAEGFGPDDVEADPDEIAAISQLGRASRRVILAHAAWVEESGLSRDAADESFYAEAERAIDDIFEPIGDDDQDDFEPDDYADA